jgi:hypothetical protein
MTLQGAGTLGDPPRRFATRPSGESTELVCLECQAAAPDRVAFIAHTCAEQPDPAPRPRRARAAEPAPQPATTSEE